MLGYASTLMSIVIGAAIAFAALTAVMFGGSGHTKFVVLSRLSVACGILAMVLGLCWFLWGQVETIAYLAVLALLFQIITSWPVIETFFTRKR